MNYKRIVFLITFLTIFSLAFNLSTPPAQVITFTEIQTLIQQFQGQIARFLQQLRGAIGPLLWDWNFCTPERPCTVGQGDCNTDADCIPSLFCAQNVGAKYGQHPAMDVCERREDVTRIEITDRELVDLINQACPAPCPFRNLRIILGLRQGEYRVSVDIIEPIRANFIVVGTLARRDEKSIDLEFRRVHIDRRSMPFPIREMLERKAEEKINNYLAGVKDLRIDRLEIPLRGRKIIFEGLLPVDFKDIGR